MQYRIKEQLIKGNVSYVAQRQYTFLFIFKYWSNHIMYPFSTVQSYQAAKNYIDKDMKLDENKKKNSVKYHYDIWN